MNPVLSAFGLASPTTADAFARALHVSNAVIFGGAALSWWHTEAPPHKQDIDIACQPSSTAMHPLIHALFDTLFRSAGYKPLASSPRNRAYYNNRYSQIVQIHNWYHTELHRQIQLVIRRPDAPPVHRMPDLDLCRLTVVPRINPLFDRVELRVEVPADLSPDRLAARHMRLYNLEGQIHDNLCSRLSKYYRRGYTLLHSHTGAPLSLEDAVYHMSYAWAMANPLARTDLRRADTLCIYVAGFLEGVPNPAIKTERSIKVLSNLLQEALREPYNRVVFPHRILQLHEYHLLLTGLLAAKEILDADTPETFAELRAFILLSVTYNAPLCAHYPELVERTSLHYEAMQRAPKPDDA